MALKEALAVKTVLGDTALELKADPGESFLIKDIRIYNPASNYLTLKTEKTTVGYFRIGGNLGSHLPFWPGQAKPVVADAQLDSLIVLGSATAADKTAFVGVQGGDAAVLTGVDIAHAGGGADITAKTSKEDLVTSAVPGLGMTTLLAWLIANGYMTGYPIAQGETFRISGVKQANAIQLVAYEIYEAEDRKPEEDNGSRALNYIYLNYGTTGANITAKGTDLYNETQNPGEFVDFPFDRVVPAKTEIDLIGILGSDFAPLANDATDYIMTQYLKLVAERTVLFDEDREGLLHLGPTGINVGGRNRIGEGWSLIGNYSDVDMRPPFILPTPLTFKSGDDLDIYLTTDGDNAYQTINEADQEIGLIQRVRRTE